MRATTHHPFVLRLPTETFDTLRAEAAARGVSVNALVNALIEDHLRTNRKQLIELIGQATSERYNTVLEKLAHL